MPITSLHYTDLLNQLYRESLMNMVQVTPGQVIEYVPAPVEKKRNSRLPIGDCIGCGAPMEEHRARCRYCRRDY